MAKGQKTAGRKSAQKSPGEYAREALAEWRKAAGYGAAALSLKERLAGVSKLGVGGRLVERLRPDVPSLSFGSNGNGAHPPVPIQEAIEVAVPVRAAYALATRFESYPDFLDRVEAAEQIGDDTIAFELKFRGRTHEVEVELVDERPEERIEWRTVEGPPSDGTISFHRLAPRLTHIELSVELEPDGVVERLTRATHLTERSIRTELHRFKAYAELWQEEEAIDEPSDEAEQDEFENEGPEAEEDDEYEDDYDEEPDDGPEGEAYIEETAHDEHHEAYEEAR
jgi:uncharacterized membrane protein